MAEELTAEQRTLLASLTKGAAKDLAEGRAPQDVVSRLVGRGLSAAAAERIVAEAKAEPPAGEATAATPMRELFVVNLPPAADPSELIGAPPLGRRGAVGETLSDVLEGLRLNAEGRGRFEGPGCVIDVDTGPDDLVSLVTLGVQGGEAARRVVRALSQKTGWRVIDRSADKLFDMPGGTPADKPSRPRTEPTPAKPVQAPPAPRRAKVSAAAGKPASETDRTVRIRQGPMERPSRRPGRMGFAALGIVLLAAAILVGLRTQLAGGGAEANEALALVDVLEFARAESVFGAANLDAYAPPEVLSDPSRYATLLNTGAPLEALGGARFVEAVRNGYRFEFRPDAGSARTDAPVTPAYRAYSYVAVPTDPGRSGLRSFAYFSHPSRTVMARDDGQPPTRQDTPIAQLPF